MNLTVAEVRTQAREQRLHFIFWTSFLLLSGIGGFWMAVQIGKSWGYQQALVEVEMRPKANLVKPVDVLAGNCLEQARQCVAKRRMERVKAGT